MMGGDFGPAVTVPAALQALIADPVLNLLLVGQPDLIKPLLIGSDPSLLNRLQIIPALDTITNSAEPFKAIRHSQGSSMREMLEMVRNGRAQACISAGNTGVLMGLSKLILQPLPGIERPALVSTLPNQHGGHTLMLDLGANTICDSKMLVQFAVMGAVIAEETLGIRQPRIALLNIGEEENKGLESIRQAAALLKKSTTIHYIGYIEGNDLLTGKADVVVCDGFIGNVTLKTLEGTVRAFPALLKSIHGHKKSVWWLNLLMRWLQRRLSKHFNPDQYNGACLLGLRGTVIKSHGAANQNAFCAAIKQAAQTVRRQVPDRISSRLEMVLLESG